MLQKTARASARPLQPRSRLDALTYAHKIFEALDTPISLGCHLRLKYGEYRQLVELSIKPQDYVDPRRFFLDYQSVKLLSKYPYLDTGIDTKQVALGKFDDAEDLCRRTNTRFRMRDDGYLFDNRVERVLSNASRKISRILGRVPTLAEMDFSFGPGAAYGVRGETSVYNKVSSALECTYVFAGKLQEFLEEFPGWFPEGIHEVALLPGSQLAFVAKDAKTDRPICIEPLLNGLYQKGVGTWIRKRLKSFGINLDDQGINRKLVSQALELNLATIDFASASDTIAYRLVMDLLPWEWFEFLDVARCPSYEHEGAWKTFQKFSSMGNAYTFELETLIFYALACACCEDLGIEYQTGVNLSVYGDDVIIPRDAYSLFSEASECCGFAINQSKSFREGVFFESCGHDYFDGEFVRPYLIKKRLNKLLPAFYAANTVKRLQRRVPKGPVSATRNSVAVDQALDHRLRDVHAWCVRGIPKTLRVLGPEGYGDGHLISEFDESRPSRHPCWDGWWFRSYTERPVTVEKQEWPMAYALYFTRLPGVVPLTRSPALEKISNAVDNGKGYTVRGRTRLQRTQVFCHGEWQSPKYSNSLIDGYDDLSFTG